MADISSNMKRLRIQRGMSQTQLAERLGVTRQTVSGWERGVSYPDLQMLEKLAEIFETDLNGLLYPQARSRVRQKGEPLRFGFVLLSVVIYVILLVVGTPIVQGIAPIPSANASILWGLILLALFVAVCTCLISVQIAGSAPEETGEE